MRSPICVRTQEADCDLREELDLIRDRFVSYLDASFWTDRSKYSVLGPVGKILAQARAGKQDPNLLKGMAVNIHEQAMARRGQGRYISAAAMADLEAAIKGLCAILGRSAPSAHRAIIETLDYGIYFARRKGQVERRERLRVAWHEFIRERYSNREADLTQTWSVPFSEVEAIPLPKKPEARQGECSARERDALDFWALQSRTVPEEEIELIMEDTQQ